MRLFAVPFICPTSVKRQGKTMFAPAPFETPPVGRGGRFMRVSVSKETAGRPAVTPVV